MSNSKVVRIPKYTLRAERIKSRDLMECMEPRKRLVEKAWLLWYRLVMGTIMLDHKMGGMLDHDVIEENL